MAHTLVSATLRYGAVSLSALWVELVWVGVASEWNVAWAGSVLQMPSDTAMRPALSRRHHGTTESMVISSGLLPGTDTVCSPDSRSPERARASPLRETRATTVTFS